jgi:hypothetical protein
MPLTEDGFTPNVELAGTDPTYAISIYEWLIGAAPLGIPVITSEIDPRTVSAFRERSRPLWLRERTD